LTTMPRTLAPRLARLLARMTRASFNWALTYGFSGTEPSSRLDDQKGIFFDAAQLGILRNCCVLSAGRLDLSAESRPQVKLPPKSMSILPPLFTRRRARKSTQDHANGHDHGFKIANVALCGSMAQTTSVAAPKRRRRLRSPTQIKKESRSDFPRLWNEMARPDPTRSAGTPPDRRA
jgi:hypothetical protein